MAMKTRFRKLGTPEPQVATADPEHSRSAEPPAARRATPAKARAERSSDPATQRIREAGGPIDRAFYSCGCGYVFVAEVSTTVKCPYCQAGQAW
jgi:hypothetical protein